MALRREVLKDGHVWWRIADPQWNDPLDPNFARRRGGRWNPPESFPVLYVNEDTQTARLNLIAFTAGWPYEPEDLREDAGPVLVGCVLPRRQEVCDAHTRAGVRAAGLPATYPIDERGEIVPWDVCQPIGERVKKAGLRGVLTHSAQSRHGERELAWFPASARSRARRQRTLKFVEWYY